MRKAFTPSIVPSEVDQTVYLVLDDLGDARVWRESSTEDADLESVIAGLVSGEYNDPLRVIAFNSADRYSEDVSADIAREIQRRADLRYEDVSLAAVDFVERHTPVKQLSVEAGLMAWQATFDEPVPTPDGQRLYTLHDARGYILQCGGDHATGPLGDRRRGAATRRYWRRANRLCAHRSNAGSLSCGHAIGECGIKVSDIS